MIPGLSSESVEYGLIGLALIAGLALGLAAMTAFDRERRARTRRLIQTAARAAPQSRAAAEAIRLTRDRPKSGVLMAALPRRSQLNRRLSRAGYKPDPRRYIAFSLVVGSIVAVALAASGMAVGVVLLGGLGAALLIPHMVLSNRIGSRETRFLTNLPEGIDIVVRGLKAGLPVSESLSAVGREAPDPVGGIFREVVDLVRIGHSVEDAIAKVSDSMAVPELRFLGITLSIQKETGGNLTETLQNLSDILRKRRQMKLKIRAVSSEARASAYIIGSLPFAVSAAIYIVNRDYVMLLFSDPRGLIMVACGLISIAVGAAVMMKMVKFDI
ncbi:MAG: type II secretion system F family protein [Pseudomonadota bacterium]|nr:type II secretion system F family protein [Pseudomonadota bacterium]